MTAVQDREVGHRVRGPFEAYREYNEPVIEVPAQVDRVDEIRTPVLSAVADVVDPAAVTMVDYTSIATVGQLPVVNEKHGVAWYVGQRGLSYFQLLTGTPLSIHSFDWSSIAMPTPEFPTVQVRAVVVAGCGTPCIPIPDHQQFPPAIPVTLCTDPRCWKQPEPMPVGEPGRELTP